MGVLIKIYGQEGCKKCESFKEKCELLGFEYEFHNLMWHITEHNDWRIDGTVQLREYCEFVRTDHIPLPIIEIGDAYFQYAEAIKEMKRIKREKHR